MNMKLYRIHIIRAAAIVVALAFIAIGVSRGDAAVVLRKAIRICLECIGVGA